MIRRMNTPYVALVLLFILCQVIGTMCDLPDLSMAGDAVPLLTEMEVPQEHVLREVHEQEAGENDERRTLPAPGVTLGFSAAR